jgi:hypothetical protein
VFIAGRAEKSAPKASGFCRTHLSAFLKSRVKKGPKISDHRKNFGNISDKHPFPEIISDYFFGQTLSKWGRPVASPCPSLSPCQSNQVKLMQRAVCLANRMQLLYHEYLAA